MRNLLNNQKGSILTAIFAVIALLSIFATHFVSNAITNIRQAEKLEEMMTALEAAEEGKLYTFHLVNRGKGWDVTMDPVLLNRDGSIYFQILSKQRDITSFRYHIQGVCDGVAKDIWVLFLKTAYADYPFMSSSFTVSGNPIVDPQANCFVVDNSINQIDFTGEIVDPSKFELGGDPAVLINGLPTEETFEQYFEGVAANNIPPSQLVEYDLYSPPVNNKIQIDLDNIPDPQQPMFTYFIHGGYEGMENLEIEVIANQAIKQQAIAVVATKGNVNVKVQSPSLGPEEVKPDLVVLVNDQSKIVYDSYYPTLQDAGIQFIVRSNNLASDSVEFRQLGEVPVNVVTNGGIKIESQDGGVFEPHPVIWKQGEGHPSLSTPLDPGFVPDYLENNDPIGNPLGILGAIYNYYGSDVEFWREDENPGW